VFKNFVLKVDWLSFNPTTNVPVGRADNSGVLLRFPALNARLEERARNALCVMCVPRTSASITHLFLSDQAHAVGVQSIEIAPR
jgi:hypothetical protein